MAVPYLSAKFDSLNLEKATSDLVLELTQSVISKFLVSLASKSIAFPEKRQRFHSKQPKQEEPLPAPKPKIDKKARDEFFEEHKKKTDESKEFTRKLIEERLERQRRIQEREKEYRIKTLQEIDEQRKQQEEVLKRMEDEKKEKIFELVKKSENRKKELGEKKEICRSPVGVKPLYKQMEDAYKQKVIMPQLEKHKAELARKRIAYKPLDPEELKEHSRHHDELKRQYEFRRKKEYEQKNLDAQLNQATNSMQSKFTIAVLEEEKRKKEEQEKANQEKLLNAHKRLQYSKLVKEMFPPVIDESRKLDTSSKSKSKIRSADFPDESIERSKKKIGVTDYKSEIGLNPARYKKKKQTEEKKVIEKFDYLAEKRKQRENVQNENKPVKIDLQNEILNESLDEKKLEKIKAKTNKIDKQAKQKELLMEKYKGEGVKGIQVGDEVNDMILSSIRAKLAILDKFQSS